MNEQLNEEEYESVEILDLDDDSSYFVTVRKSFGIPVRQNEEEYESVEILDLDDDSSDSVTVRKSFRIPIRQKEGFSIVIDGISFPLENINSKGAGVLMVEDHSFFKEQLLSDCELILGSDKFDKVECQIVRINSEKDTLPVFGIRWLNMDDKIALNGNRRIGEICEDLKKHLLAESFEDMDNGIYDAGK